jgi:hypothetical protein
MSCDKRQIGVPHPPGWHVDIPIEDTDWQIGLIVGPSGSGKTTIGRRLFLDASFHNGYACPRSRPSWTASRRA